MEAEARRKIDKYFDRRFEMRFQTSEDLATVKEAATLSKLTLSKWCAQVLLEAARRLIHKSAKTS